MPHSEQQERLEEAFERIEETILPCISMMLETLIDASQSVAENERRFLAAELKTLAASVAGGLIASYQIGYGIAAFGVGPLASRWALSLGTIYGWTTGVALALAVLAVLIARHPARLIAEAPRVRVQSPIQTSTITHPGDEP